MSKLKKKIPIIVLETLEPFLTRENPKIRLVDPGTYLMKFEDNDEDSSFYFIVEQYQVQSGKFQLLLNFTPRSKEDTSAYRHWVGFEHLKNKFDGWIDLIERYDSIKSIYDNPIEKQYEGEFYTQFEIIDEDADIVGFNLEQQIFLDGYLENTLEVLEQFNPNGDNDDLNEIKMLTSELKSDLSRLTKKKVIQKLSKIWAKARLQGLEILKEIYVQAKKELIKELITNQIGQIINGG